MAKKRQPRQETYLLLSRSHKARWHVQLYPGMTWCGRKVHDWIGRNKTYQPLDLCGHCVNEIEAVRGEEFAKRPEIVAPEPVATTDVTNSDVGDPSWVGNQ